MRTICQGGYNLPGQPIHHTIGQPCSIRAGTHLLSQAHDMASQMLTPAHGCQYRQHLKLAWISSHDNVAGNEEVDAQAKEAAKGKSSKASTLPPFLCQNVLPCSISAAHQAFKADLFQKWKTRWQASPRYVWLNKIDDLFPLKHFLKNISALSRAQVSLVTQLQTRHVPLNKHLHNIHKAASPICPCCRQANKTVHHFLFDCHTHDHVCIVVSRAI